MPPSPEAAPATGTAASLTLLRARRLPETNALELTWNDGHRAEFPLPYLRGYCPCAQCQGHHAAKIVFHAPKAAHPITLGSIEPVGRYGLSLGFSDGHATGIYRFDFLRRICPCPDCRAARHAAQPTPSAEETELLHLYRQLNSPSHEETDES